MWDDVDLNSKPIVVDRPYRQFEKSAAIYDIIHASKDYKGETQRICKYLKHGIFLPRLIDWGCGTGRFTEQFIRYGFDSVGVEPCAGMVEIAKAKRLTVFEGTIQNPPKQIRGQYENAVCLYGAFSYATVGSFGSEEPHLSNALRSVHSHLVRGGRFVFDVINYACAAKHLREDTHDVFQGYGEPRRNVERWMKKTFDTHHGIVYHDIHYKTHDQEWTEHHSMKAFTPSEIRYALKDCQFSVLDVIPNEDDGELTLQRVKASDYYFTVIAEAL